MHKYSKQEKHRNFRIIETGYSDFNLPYDYQSIMHYPSNAFAINPNIPTIEPLQKGVVLKRSSQKTSLTSSDITAIRKLYACIA